MRSDIESCVKLGVNIQQKFPNTYAVIDYYTRLLRNAQEGLQGVCVAFEQRCTAVERHAHFYSEIRVCREWLSSAEHQLNTTYKFTTSQLSDQEAEQRIHQLKQF